MGEIFLPAGSGRYDLLVAPRKITKFAHFDKTGRDSRLAERSARSKDVPAVLISEFPSQ